MQSERKVCIDDIVVSFDPYSVSNEYNPHKNMHQTVAEYFEYNNLEANDYDDCVKADKFYVLRVYPDNSVGFYEICGRWHDDLINRMIEVLRKDKAKR